eukprot:TRINITY_DN88895_c0_g1_i1.p1 TRINITY_DN88895_c0_g1~~TRINITY_DN88895_c0_g1_i1.p1  ORF type:complete len:666 (-),score=79.20 TRINITY_DN88895_c0_g1_i1:149-2122(-)
MAVISQRFRELLASELQKLEVSVVAACEYEFTHVGEQNGELERAFRGAEDHARRLEQEVRRLKKACIHKDQERSLLLDATETAGAEVRQLSQQVQRLRAENAELLRCTLGTFADENHGGGKLWVERNKSQACMRSTLFTPERSQSTTDLGSSDMMGSMASTRGRHINSSPKHVVRELSIMDDTNETRDPTPPPPLTGNRTPNLCISSNSSRRSNTPRKASSAQSSEREKLRERTDGLQQINLHTRQNYDKRTLRRMHCDPFMMAIKEWREQHVVPSARPPSHGSCHVFVRARPLFDLEFRQGEFDVVTVSDNSGEVVVHNCLFQADLVRMYIQHSGFCFTRAFSPSTGNDEVYAEVGAPLVAHALHGELATLFMFGQTGSGKTYTMEAILDMTCSELCSFAPNVGKADVRMKAFEIIGKKCFDLFSDERAELRLLEDENGHTNIIGAREISARTSEECQQTWKGAFSARSVAGHGRNDESSRSHCICVVELPATGGSLVLVDCAGTERRQDSEQHSSERVRESAEINTSLHALKECIRGWQRQQQSIAGGIDFSDDDHHHVRVPYRSSQLTRVLQDSFTRSGARLHVIGTVSPAALDTEHTLSTLNTLALLQLGAGRFESKVDVNNTSTYKHATTTRSRAPSSPARLSTRLSISCKR